MIIESLTFQVSADPDSFIDSYGKIWGKWLAQQPGFISNRTDSVRGNQVTVLLFWQSANDMELAYNDSSEMDTLNKSLSSQINGPFRLIHYYLIGQ